MSSASASRRLSLSASDLEPAGKEVVPFRELLCVQSLGRKLPIVRVLRISERHEEADTKI